MNKEITLKKNIGYKNLESQFQKIVSLRKNQTWMLIGKRGVGKRTLSMRFAGYIINDFDFLKFPIIATPTKIIDNKINHIMEFLNSLSTKKIYVKISWNI